MIIRVSDQLRCGGISLFKVNHEEAEAAKAHLDAPRKKPRERYPKNQDRIYAGQRETFALKKSTEPYTTIPISNQNRIILDIS